MEYGAWIKYLPPSSLTRVKGSSSKNMDLLYYLIEIFNA